MDPAPYGYVLKMFFGENMDLIPIKDQGSASTGFCDYAILYTGSNERFGTRSGQASSPESGVSSLSLNLLSDSKYAYLGSRIAFRGDYVIVE